MLPVHTKVHSCYAGATARSMHAIVKFDQALLPSEWEKLERFDTAQLCLNKLREELLGLDMSTIPTLQSR